jgi:aminopeptidase N
MHDVNPIHYNIRLEPDLRTLKFSGSAEIVLEVSEKVNEITLNAKDLAFLSCAVLSVEEFVECPFYVDAPKGELVVHLPKGMSGDITLKITYIGDINDRMAGFYRSRYTVEGKTRYCAVTQFEESDARRAFPCLDHPLKKATFTIELVIAEKLVAISNMSIAEETPIPDGRKIVRFRKTPKMSTYLLFFGVGEFEFIEDKGEVLLRAGTMPGMTEHAQYGLEFGRKALQFCEHYYGIKYPLPKLDLIAIPDFVSGAMENWGAITFRENLLLHYPNITSRAGEQRICEVIAHEIVHQWFGNLVTPSDWKYLWLNESFATYFGYGVVAHFYPERDMWGQFLHSQTNIALARDALHESVPIELPGGERAVINASTAPIIYNKGASILRHIKGYIGEESYKAGLRRYLRQYQYTCASSYHLWEALEETAEKPVTEIMKSWVGQPGFPILHIARQRSKLVITQQRFTYLPNESDQAWIVPISIEVFYPNNDSKRVTALVKDMDMEIDIGDDVIAYKVNHEQTGFYRVKYLDKGNLSKLGKRVMSKELSTEDRWGLQNDLYALVRSGDTTIDEYLSFLSNFEKEDAFLPLISISANLYQAYLILDSTRREMVGSVGKSLLEKVLSRIHYEPDPKEHNAISILRDHIMPQAALYGSEDVRDFACGKFSILTAGKSIHPDIMKSAMYIGALNGDSDTFEWFKDMLKSSISEHERINILISLGGFRQRSLIEGVQDYTLSHVPDRNKFIPIGSLASNPHAMPFMWEWYVSHVDILEQCHPVVYERVIEAIVPMGGIGKEGQVNEFFEDYMGKKDRARDVIKMSLENLRINSRMRYS